MYALNKNSQSVTPLVIIFGLIGIVFGFFFGIASNIYFLSFLMLVLFFVSFVSQDFAIIFIILSTFLLPAIKIGETQLREVTIRPEDILVIVVLAGWIAKMAIYKEIGLLKHTILNKPIIAYSLICLVSTIFGVFNGSKDAKDAFFFLTKYFEYFLLFFMVANNCKSLAQAKRFIHFMLFTYLLVCLWGWHQIPQGNRVIAPFGNDEPNTLSGYLVLMMGLNFALLLYARTFLEKLIYGIMLALAIAPFLFTLSRGGILAFIPMVVTLIFFTKKYKGILLIASVIVALSLPVLLPNAIQQRLKDSFVKESSVNIMGKTIYMAESAALRIQSWNYAFEILQKYPAIGVGVPGGGVIDGQFPRVMIEVGLLGLAIFVWLLISLFRLGINGLSDNEAGAFMHAISLGFTAGLIGLLFHSLSVATFILIRVMEPFWILAGILVAMQGIEQVNQEQIPETT